MPYLKSLADDATQDEIFGRWPGISQHIISLAQQLLCDGPLPRAQAELIFTFVSGLNKCQYAYEIHRYTCVELGMDEKLIESLFNGIEQADIDDKLRALLLYLKKLTEIPSEVIRSDADAVFETGWSEDEFHYAVSICAFTNYMNRSLSGHGIVGSAEHWEKSGRSLATRQYQDLLSG